MNDVRARVRVRLLEVQKQSNPNVLQTEAFLKGGGVYRVDVRI